MEEKIQLLQTQIDALTETIGHLLSLQQQSHEKLDKYSAINNELMRRSEIMRRIIDNQPYELNDSRYEFNYIYPKFEPMDETIRKIGDEHMSLARFGDGEFAIMRGINRHKFQKNDGKLSERLKQVLHSDLDNMLIGIADNFGNLSRFTDEAAHGIRMHMSLDMRSYLDSVLDKDRIYADGYITRFYALMRDNASDAPRKRLELLRSMWYNRNVIMVEGAQTRLGVGNDLFNNAASIKRILGPAVNSFDMYDEILAESLNNASDEVLFLIALGPTAGVLAYDLTKEGYQALDIGHIDMEYEWYLAGQGKRVDVKGKYNNEVPGGDKVNDIVDPKYESQIIAKCI